MNIPNMAALLTLKTPCGSTSNCQSGISLVKNNLPIGEAQLIGNADSSGVYPSSTVVSGYAFDPDHSNTVSLRFSAKIPTVDSKTCERSTTDFSKDIMTSLQSSDACNLYQTYYPGICDRNVGFSTSFADLGLPPGTYGLNVSALNVAIAPQAPTDAAYVDIGGSPLSVKIGTAAPDPFCGSLSYTLDPKKFKKSGMTLKLSRTLTESIETMTIRVCEDKGGEPNTALLNTDPQTCFADPSRTFAPLNCIDRAFSFDAHVAAKEIGLTGLKEGTAYVAFVLPQGSRSENLAPARWTTPGKAPKPPKPTTGTGTLVATQDTAGNVFVTFARAQGCYPFTSDINLSCSLKKAYKQTRNITLAPGVASETVSFAVGTGNNGKSCKASVANPNPKITVKEVSFKMN